MPSIADLPRDIAPARHAVALRTLATFEDDRQHPAAAKLLRDAAVQVERLRDFIALINMDGLAMVAILDGHGAAVAESVKSLGHITNPLPGGDWTTLAEDVSLPGDFAAALMTARPELLNAIHRPLDVAETKLVARLIGVLIRTNQGLQHRMSAVHTRVEDLSSSLGGITSTLDNVAEFLTTGDEDLLSSRRARERVEADG